MRVDDWIADADRIYVPQPEPNEGPPTIPALAFLDIAAWSRKPIPPREWVVPDLIPAKNVAVLSGHGATGKTTLALQLCAATALGRGWLNYLPEPGPAMAVCCEDDADELHRRMADIASHYGVEVSDLAEDLHLLSRAGEDGVLGSPDRFGIVRSTKLFEQIRTAARKIRPRLIVLDNAADTYAGNENDRAMVRQFYHDASGTGDRERRRCAVDAAS